MGVKTPNLGRGDVLIEGGRIAEVGSGLRARDAEQVDASDTVVMPGFIDTHRHAWKSLFRNLGSPSGDAGPAAFEDLFHADDVYAATLIGLLGAAEAGITTVVDWSDLRTEDGLAEAALRAHADSGLRTVFVHGTRRRGPIDPEPIAGLTGAAGPMTTIAFGSVLPGPNDVGAAGAGWALARELGMRIHAHAGPGRAAGGTIRALAEQGLLRDDVVLTHCSELDDADVDAIASTGASVSLTPSSQMAGGLGSPSIQQLIDRDIRPGLGIEDERVAPGDQFAQMRATISLQHATVFDRKLAGKAGLPRLMSTRDVVRSATVEGARVAGLGGVTGSLEPGMQADVIMLRTDRPNVFPINDPIGAVVWGMDTSNLDRVFVAGRAVMRGGALETDVERARNLATIAHERVTAAAGLVIGAARGGGG